MNWLEIKAIAAQAPLEKDLASRPNLPIIHLPSLQGGTEGFQVVESPIMDAAFSRKYPDIHTYVLYHVSDSRISGRMMITDTYLHIVLLDGKGITLIRPDDLANPQGYSMGTFDEENAGGQMEEYCNQSEDAELERIRSRGKANNSSRNSSGFSNAIRRTYNLAVVTTGEFHDANGGSIAAASAVVVASVNAIQAIYDRELSIRFTLLTPFVYTDYLTDPFDPTSATSRTLQAANAVGINFASGTYDIGHVFHDQDQGPGPYFAGGGVAGLGVVCQSGITGVGAGLQKGRGWSGSFNNTSSSWYRLAAHEFGHMFDANHTFNGSGGSCTLGNISNTTSYEIASGTTIMSYRGICGTGQNVPSSGELDHYFHANSLDEMLAYVASSGTCATTAATGNTAPVANANPGAMTYTIPAETPFTLTGAGTDIDGDDLTYTWEQFDEDGAGATPTQGFTGAVAAASAIAPLFRSYPPSSSPARTFPEISNILAGTNAGVTFEALPNATRTMNFVLTVRDNNASGGGVNCAATTVGVDATTGPFLVTSQNVATNWTANGANTATITWDVAGTTGGSVNCANVDILFSIDGGITFPYTLASATLNDGSHMITIPSYSTYAGRIKVQCSDNIFFDINNDDIVLSSSCLAEGTTISPSTPVTEIEGDAALNLTLTPEYGAVLTTFSETLESTDPASVLAADNGAGSCTFFGGNATVYHSYTFEVDQADTYTFTQTAGPFGVVLNLYQGAFNASSVCNNWIAGSFNSGTSILSSFVSQALVPGVAYTIVVSSFSTTLPLPTLPAAFVVTATSAGTGSIYDGIPNPGGSFAYTYVIVNNASGTITAIDAASDLSNSGTFPAGSYTVYGLSYLSSENLVPYVGGAFSALQNDLAFLVICGELSLNLVEVTITPSILPVQYLFFDAELMPENRVALSWATTSEADNDYFELERRGVTGDFSPITRVKGKGSVQGYEEYAFVDSFVTEPRVWYRLKQVDLNGEFTYSEIREIALQEGTDTYLLYPNPATESITLVPPKEKQGQAHQVLVYDLQGKMVLKKAFASEKDRLEVDIQALTKGLYMIHGITDQGEATWMKFLKE
jgi:hypothetical protein